MKRRVFLIYLSPIAIILPILWVFGPEWLWQSQEHHFSRLTVSVRWENTTAEDAVADLNQQLKAQGSPVRIRLDPQLKSKRLHLWLSNAAMMEAVGDLGALLEAVGHVDGPRSIRFATMERWSPRAKIRWGCLQLIDEIRYTLAPPQAADPVEPLPPQGFGFDEPPVHNGFGDPPPTTSPSSPDDPFAQ